MRDERCPRCGHDLYESEVRPGVSRWDDTTRVCAWCSEHEAMQQAFGEPLPDRVEWWDHYTGGPVDDYRLVLVARGTEADKVTLELWTLSEQARADLYRRRHDVS